MKEKSLKILVNMVVVVLVILAVASGVAKIMLLPQEVDFFGQYGFSNPILILYGSAQLMGGVLLAVPKVRQTGALIVGLTFIVSAVLLTMAGNIALTAVTLICVLLLGFIVKYPFNTARHKTET